MQARRSVSRLIKLCLGVAAVAALGSGPAFGQSRSGSNGFGSMGSSFGGGVFSGNSGGGGSFVNSFANGSSSSGFGGNSFGAGMGGGSPFGTGFGSSIGSDLTGGSFRPGSGSGFTTNQAVSNTNPFATYYGNPLAYGLVLGSNTSQARFGSPLYGNLSSNVSGSFNSTAIPGQSPMTLSPNTARRPIYYTFTPSFPTHRLTGGRLAEDAQAVIARSTSLVSKDGIKVALDGDTIVLRGAVSDDHERRLAESLIRFTPGVHEVRNELQVRASAASNGTRND